MPKRTIALYDDQNFSSDEDTDNDDIDLQDYLTDPDCTDIIKNQHFFDFEEKMGHKLTYIYIYRFLHIFTYFLILLCIKKL